MLVQNICSKEACNMLISNNNTFLVDVRTEEEWKYVGVPSLDNKEIIFLSWQLSPFMELNRDFEDRFLSIIDDKISNIIFFYADQGIDH